MHDLFLKVPLMSLEKFYNKYELTPTICTVLNPNAMIPMVDHAEGSCLPVSLRKGLSPGVWFRIQAAEPDTGT